MEYTVCRCTDAGEKYGCTFLHHSVAQLHHYFVVIPLILKALPVGRCIYWYRLTAKVGKSVLVENGILGLTLQMDVV